MSAPPKVSIIIPVYNAENYLIQCLKSVTNQTLQDVEIIFVDDGSIDGSYDILTEYAKKDSRIRVIQQGKLNAGAARNAGLQIASGEYLSFLDVDDIFCLDMLEKAYKHAEETSTDIVLFRSGIYYEETKSYENAEWRINTDSFPASDIFTVYDVIGNIFVNILGYTWDKLFKRSYILENKIHFQSIPVFNDSFFTYTSILMGGKLSFLNHTLLYQRKRATKDSITDRRSNYYDAGYQMLKGIKEFLVDKNIYERFRQDFVNYAVHILKIDLSSKQGDMRQKMVAELKNSWLYELDVLKYNKDYFYDPQVYNKFFDDVLKNNKEVLLAKNSDSRNNNLLTIPIVYAADDGYLKFVSVSIESVLSSTISSVNYRFIILVPQNANIKYKELINQIANEHSNCTVEFIEIGNQFDNAHLCIKHITTPTYYRLLLADLLQDCDKCIYLDGDTIVCDDIAALYDIDLKENLIAGVRAYVYYRTAQFHSQRLGLLPETPFEYVNAGVLLMNLAEIRKQNATKRFMALINEKFDSQDQDIINVVCQGKIKLLPFRFNVMTKYYRWKQFDFNGLIQPGELMIGKQSPAIIHYADKIKPWNNIHSPYAKEWLCTALSGISWAFFAKEKTPLLINEIYHSGIVTSNLDRCSQEVAAIHASWSYRIGRFITFVPRKIRGGIRCYQEHGMQYTLHRAKEKFLMLVRRNRK